MLGVVIAGSFWVKKQYPESAVAKGINCLLAQGQALVKKPVQTQESAEPAATPPSVSAGQVSVVAPEAIEVAEKPLSEVAVNARLSGHPDGKLDYSVTPSLTVAEPANLSVTESESVKIKAPEDQVLRRHFLTQLRAEVEAQFLPRPTDSTLLRHYESLIHTEIASRLQEAV